MKSLRMKWTQNVHASVRTETYAEVWWDNPKKITTWKIKVHMEGNIKMNQRNRM